MVEPKIFKTNSLLIGLTLFLRFLIVLILGLYILPIFLDNPTITGFLIAAICAWGIYSIIRGVRKMVSINIKINDEGIICQTQKESKSMSWLEIQKMIHPSGIAFPYFMTAKYMDYFILYNNAEDYYLNFKEYGEKIEIPPTVSSKNKLIKEIIKRANLKKKIYSLEPTWEKSNELLISSDFEIGYISKFSKWLLVILLILSITILVLDYFTGFSKSLF